jgi:hypothetical protein
VVIPPTLALAGTNSHMCSPHVCCQSAPGIAATALHACARQRAS